MVSTFTSNVNLEKQGTGDNDGTWGTELNENFDQIDAAIGGETTFTVTTADVTLTETQYRNRRIQITGTLTGNRSLILPALNREWVIDNQTGGSFTVTAKTAAGSGVVCPQKFITEVMGDGGNIVSKEILHVNQREIYGGTTAGSSTAYTLTMQPVLPLTANDAGTIVTGFWHTTSGASPTLNVNGAGAWPILTPSGGVPATGGLASGTRFQAMYDGATSWYLLAVPDAAVRNGGNTFAGTQTISRIDMTGSINRAEGASVAAASSPNIWAQDGDTIHITGATTITGFAAAPQAGCWKELIFDSNPQITQDGNLITPGGVNLFMAAGDRAMIYAETTTQFRFWHFPAGYAPAKYAPLRGFIDGCRMKNSLAGDNVNDIDVEAGMATSDDAATMMVLSALITKRLDAGWAVGSTNGGLDTDAEASATWYHVWLIRRPDTGVVDVLFSLSATAPTMPTNYTQKRRLGAFFNDSGSSIRKFFQNQNEFLWETPPALDVDVTNLDTSAVLYTLSVPTGIRVKALFNMALADAAAQSVYLSSPDTANVASSGTATPLHTAQSTAAGGNVGNHGLNYLWTNASAQIRAVSSAVNTNLAIATLGWIDPRGCNA